MRRTLPAIVLLGATLAGCTGTQQPAYHFWSGQGKDTGQAPDCTTSLPLFGISLTQGLYPPNGSMTARSDGAACTLDVLFTYGAPARVDVTQPPAHGALQVLPAQDGVGLSYRPASGYAGGDRFSVTADVGGRLWSIPVAVTVTR